MITIQEQELQTKFFENILYTIENFKYIDGNFKTTEKINKYGKSYKTLLLSIDLENKTIIDNGDGYFPYDELVMGDYPTEGDVIRVIESIKFKVESELEAISAATLKQDYKTMAYYFI